VLQKQDNPIKLAVGNEIIVTVDPAFKVLLAECAC
jgi:hypothetical protein